MGDYADDAVNQALDFELDMLDAEPDDEFFNGGHRAPVHVICPYCGEDAKFVGGDHVYPHRPDLFEKRFWVCDPCDARVGCHPSGDPLGPLANSVLREARMQAHKAFDPFWKDGSMSRKEAYRWLAKTLGIPKHQAHIGQADAIMCSRIVSACHLMRYKQKRGGR